MKIHPLVKLTTAYFRSFPLIQGKYRLRELLRVIFRDKKFLAEIGDGIRMFLSMNEPMEAHLFFEGVYEQQITACFKAILQPDDVFVDVGANIGLYTLLAAQRMGPRGKLFAFEPAPSAYRLLERNVGANRFPATIYLLSMGCSDQEGELILHLSADRNQGLHTFGKPDFTSLSTVTVPTCRLDNYLDKQNISHVDLLKVDVEGWEYHVLKGCGNLLRQAQRPWVLFEACEHHAQAAGNSVYNLKSYLTEQGYLIFKITEDAVLFRVKIEEAHVFDSLLAIPEQIFPASTEYEMSHIPIMQISNYRTGQYAKRT